MNNKKLILTVLILVALAQLYVPAKMILDREKVLAEGIEFKFKTAPIDPNDPFRGKYINLQYENNVIEVQSKDVWVQYEDIYVILAKDNYGFAKIKSVSKAKPNSELSFVKAKVRYIGFNNSHKLTIDYPFDRYYMEESKAYDAEKTYRNSLRDTSKVTYALVFIKDGEAVLNDVLINGVSIREIVKTGQEIKK